MNTWTAFWIFLVVNAAYDAARWNQVTGLEHLGRFLIRALFCAFLAFVVECGYPCQYPVEALKTFLLMGSLWWVAFDPLLNLLYFRNIPRILHLGTTAPTDYFFRWIWGVEDPYSEERNDTPFLRRTAGALITQYAVKAILLYLTYSFYLTPISWQLIS